jgi:hypothetical protein
MALSISVDTAMYVADSSYPKLAKFLGKLDPTIRRDAAIEWRNNFRQWVGNADKAAAKQAEEEFFVKW